MNTAHLYAQIELAQRQLQAAQRKETMIRIEKLKGNIAELKAQVTSHELVISELQPQIDTARNEALHLWRLIQTEEMNLERLEHKLEKVGTP